MKTAITIVFDDDRLDGYTDEYVAQLWHVAQANPAAFGDRQAGDTVERIGREIVRRWLSAQPPSLWHHQGRHHTDLALRTMGVVFKEGTWQQNGARQCGAEISTVEAREAAPAAQTAPGSPS